MEAVAIVELGLQIIGVTSLALQVIPMLDKKNRLKPVLQVVGKYVAMNKQWILPAIQALIDAIASFKKK